MVMAFFFKNIKSNEATVHWKHLEVTINKIEALSWYSDQNTTSNIDEAMLQFKEIIYHTL